MHVRTYLFIIAGLLLLVLLIAGGYILWLINREPDLPPLLPHYPNAILLKETPTIPGRIPQLVYSCDSDGNLGVKDYRAYTTDDTPQQVLEFYRQEAAKNGFGNREKFGIHISFKTLVEVSNKLVCLEREELIAKEYASYAILFLDPNVKEEAAVIADLLPGGQVKGLVVLVTRGLILYDG